MAKVRFKASIKLEKQGEIILCLPVFKSNEADDAERKNEYRKVRDFLLKKSEKEKKTGKTYSVWAELEIYFKKAPPNQWALFRMMIDRAADHDGIDYKEIYAGLRRRYFPKESDGQTPKISSDLTTVDLAKVIQGAFVEFTQRPDPVDLSDLYVLWKDYRHNVQKKDPLQGTYKDEKDYRDRNPICEICGKGLTESEDADGIIRREGQLLHIVSIAAGGPDTDDNRLMACSECHMLKQHPKGWPYVIEMYPHIRGAVEYAQAKYPGSVTKTEEPKKQIADFKDDFPLSYAEANQDETDQTDQTDQIDQGELFEEVEREKHEPYNGDQFDVKPDF